MSRAEQLSDLVLEICQEVECRTNLSVQLDEIAGMTAEDVAWFATVLAERSPDHAAQVVELVVRLNTEARTERAHRRIEQQIAQLSADHSPPPGWDRPVLDAATAHERRTSLWRALWRRLVGSR